MKKQALSLAAIIAGACPAVSYALSLGDIDSNSSFGQPLRAQIELLSTSPEEARQLNVRLAPRNVFSRVGIERPRFLDNIRFRSTVNAQGKPVIAVSSSEPIKEPFVNFLLEVSWPQGQLLKEYTLLLNPPVLLQPDNTVGGREAGVRPEPGSTGRVNRPPAQNNANSTAAAPQPVAARPTNNSARQPTRTASSQQPASRQQARPGTNTQRAAAPQRRQQPEGSGNASPRVYRVRSGDTLFEVANRVRQPGANADQMMMALLRANPDAFIKNNINALRAGATLRVPSANDARRLNSAEARRQVRKQYADWRKFRSTLAQNTVSQEAPNRSSSRSNNRSPSASTPASRNQPDNRRGNNPRVEIVGDSRSPSASRGAGSGRAAELENQLDLAKEALSTANRKNNELDSRLKELQELVAQKDRVLELRNAELARLKQQVLSIERATAPGQVARRTEEPPNRPTNPQSQLNPPTADVDNRGETSKPPITNYVPNPVVPQPGVINSEVKSPILDNLAQQGRVNNNLNPGNTGNGSPAGSTNGRSGSSTGNTPEEKPRLPSRENQESQGTDLLSLLTSPTAWTIGAGALASLLFLWLLSRFLGRRRADPVRDNEPLDHYGAMNDPDIEPPLRNQVPVSDRNNFQDLEAQLDQAEKNDRFDDPFGVESLDESRRSPANTAATATVNSLHDNRDAPPVADTADQEEDEVLMEANVYIAYGLHQQAESELKKALEKHPDRLEYRHKLLENYFSANNREAFDQSAQAFLDTRGSRRDSKMWQDIATWGNKISPDNPLYREEQSGPGLGVGAAVAAAGAAVAGGAAAAVSGLGRDNDPPPLPDAPDLEPYQNELNPNNDLFAKGRQAQADVDQALNELDEQNPDFRDFDFGLDELKQDLASVGDTTSDLVSDGKDFAHDTANRIQNNVDALEARTVDSIDSAKQNIANHADDLRHDAQAGFDDTFDFTLDDLSADSVSAGDNIAPRNNNDLDDIEDLGQALDRELDYTLDDLSTDLQQEAAQAKDEVETQRANFTGNDDHDFELNELPADPQVHTRPDIRHPDIAAENHSALSGENRVNDSDIEPLDFDSLLGDERTPPPLSPEENQARDHGDREGSGIGGMVAAAGAAAAGAASAAAAGLLGKKDRSDDRPDGNEQTHFDNQLDDLHHDFGANTQPRPANHADAEIDDLLSFDDDELNFDLPDPDAQRNTVSEFVDDAKTTALQAGGKLQGEANDLAASAQQAGSELSQDLEAVGRTVDEKVDDAVSNVTNLNLHLDKDSGLQKILPDDTPYTRHAEDDARVDKDEWLGDIDDALSFLDTPDDDIDLHEAHISTKLDLARAYLDMGDIEGARSTLEEVMVEGNDNQRREAETLLHQTG